MIREEGCGEAVGSGKEAVLRSNAGKGFDGFLSRSAVAVVASESVHSNERDGSDGIGTGRGRILKRLATNVEAAHGRSVGRAIEEAAVFSVAVARDGEIHGFLSNSEIARI